MFSDHASYYRLISFTKFNAQFLYSLTICMLHYNPRHVSSINMPVFMRTNCIITASGIVTLCKRLYSMPDVHTESDDSRASTFPSSGGQIVLSQHLVSSLSVSGCTVCRMRAEQNRAEQSRLLCSALIRHTLHTESDVTRCCDNTICPPEDGHVDARNMSRIVM